MQVFHNDHGWPVRASIRRERLDDRTLAPVAHGIVHGIVERVPFASLGQIEQVEMVAERLEKNRPRARDMPDFFRC